MAGDDPTTPKTQATNEKLFGITNTKTHIPIVLDLNELNYDLWSELFTLHGKSFGVLNFIDVTSSSADQGTEEWEKLDSLVKLWIFGTISKPLLQRVLKKNVRASDVWKNLKNVFHVNKSARAMQLDNDLRTIELGSLTITEYCHKINRIDYLLANIDSPIDEKNLVTYVINDLSDKYEGVASVIPSDEELEAPIEDQPLPADASPTALSPGYIADFDPEEDEEDPEEDPADHPVDGGDNDDNESSDDDDDDDDVVKDEEDEEEEEHLARPTLLLYLYMILSPQAKDTKAIKTDESASTPPTFPYHIILFSKTKSCIVRMSI
ncbi:hybrid signal transduction histidine kinase M [Tanacetum coccineum]